MGESNDKRIWSPKEREVYQQKLSSLQIIDGTVGEQMDDLVQKLRNAVAFIRGNKYIFDTPSYENVTQNEFKNHFEQILYDNDSKYPFCGRNVVDETITDDDIIVHIKNLSKKTPPGTDGLVPEGLIYATPEVQKLFARLVKDIYTGNGFPQTWREQIINPLLKDGHPDGILESYRSKSILNAGYRVYANFLKKALHDEIIYRNLTIFPDNQMGYRENLQSNYVLYILNHLVHREVIRNGNKLYACFLDMKSAFDSVNRKLLWEHMLNNGFSEKIVEKLKEVYHDTYAQLGVDGERFRTNKGVRLGCPLSLILFPVFTGDLEQELKKAGTGGVPIGEIRMWSLSFGDDTLLLATKPSDLRAMIGITKQLLDSKHLSLNLNKSKVMVFRKPEVQVAHEEWCWGDEPLEEVEEYEYMEQLYTGIVTSLPKLNVKEEKMRKSKNSLLLACLEENKYMLIDNRIQ